MEILLLLILIIDVFKSLIKLKKNNLKSNIYIYIYINIVPWIFYSPKITINSLSKNNFIKIT